MPSALDFDPFSQAEWSDSSDSTEPGPLPQLGYFVPVRCRCDRVTRHVCRRSRRSAATAEQSDSPKRPKLHGYALVLLMLLTS
ncbi:hypothetical protein RR48_07270 [Papilio machaon]|uniref:Uncharacterized protein n=1 Tax=Papilio machaon TaxID=76193 RepID=A0A194RR80_PAPMA|nr:hypothetical protein RR48_07270 [Papilio machaon]